MADWNEYFSKTRPPSNLEEAKRTIQDFAVKHRQLGRNIVLVTSGGTTVPIESNTVRFVDNFSQGTRGAASAEYFLLHGYAVIFLHRQRSFEPFCRHFEGHNMLDLLELQLDTSGAYRLTVDESRTPGLQDVVRRYKEVQTACLILKIGFMTLSDYLFLLHASAEALSPLANHVMFYLAAAVSDFYVPESEMNEHKIQSSDKGFLLTMSATPKMMSPLVREWAKDAFVVSFKLETDMNIISRKAKEALQKYKHQVVIANMLQTRRKTVILVTPGDEVPIWMSDEELEFGKEIEEKIVAELYRRHLAMIQGGQAAGTAQVQNSLVGNNMAFSTQQPQHQYQTQNSINTPTTPSTPAIPSTMPGLAPINVYQANNSSTNATKLHLLHLKSTGDAELNNEILAANSNNLLKRSVSAKEDTGGLTNEMQEFIKEFKTRRVNLGYTQDDVGRELSALNGPTYSQSFISRFEGKQLGMKAAERMRPILETWIQSKEEDANSGNKFLKKRRKRTSFQPECIQLLNDYFQKNQKPTNEEMIEISNKIQMDVTTVKVWFCNKKQSLKRLGQPPTFNRVNSVKLENDGKKKRKAESPDVFPLTAASAHSGLKTLLPVSTPTGQITVPFFISQDGNPIPFVSAAAVNNTNVQSTTPAHALSTPQQIVQLSPLFVNNAQNDGSQQAAAAAHIIQGGRIIPSGSVLQIPGGAIATQQHLQQQQQQQQQQQHTANNLNDPTVIITAPTAATPGAESAINSVTNSIPGANSTLTTQQHNGNRSGNTPQNNRIFLNSKGTLSDDITENDLQSDEVCVSDDSNKSDKLVPRSNHENNDGRERTDKL